MTKLTTMTNPDKFTYRVSTKVLLDGKLYIDSRLLFDLEQSEMGQYAIPNAISAGVNSVFYEIRTTP